MNLTKRASLPSFLGLLCLGIIPNLRNRKRLVRQVYGGAVASVSFISDCLEQVQIRLLETCEGLTQEEVVWRPAPYANNIGLILWHVTRAEDNLIPRLENGSTLWAVGMRSLASPWMRRIQLIG